MGRKILRGDPTTFTALGCIPKHTPSLIEPSISRSARSRSCRKSEKRTEREDDQDCGPWRAHLEVGKKDRRQCTSEKRMEGVEWSWDAVQTTHERQTYVLSLIVPLAFDDSQLLVFFFFPSLFIPGFV